MVVVVWDGMRPDFITPQYTPNLYKMAREGVFFKAHHCVYVSSTQVNGAAIGTGFYPNHTGIMSNVDYRPSLGWLAATGVEGVDVVRRGDLLTDGHYLPVPTIAEILQKAGYPTVVAGTKTVTLLQDRSNKRKTPASAASVTLYKGRTLPSSALEPLVKVNEKEFPTNVTHPNVAQDAWTTKSLTHSLWKKQVPKFTLLWLSDPDYTQHDSSPGSPASIGALESSDKNLGEVLKTLEERGLREKSDIFVVSDHGFSTIDYGPNVAAILKRANFKATRKFEDPDPGDILVVGHGGSVSFYVFEQDEETIRKLAEFLQGSDFAGVIFSRLSLPGTFPLHQIRLDTTTATPDLVVALRWSEGKNQYGVPGLIACDEGGKGKGSHSSLSRFDMRNTLVVAGPDFRRGYLNEIPSGNSDLAPTILAILGIQPPEPMEGRLLTEAMIGGSSPAIKPEQKTIEATHDLGLFHWRQYLKITTYGQAIYFDEGNGIPTPK